MLWVGVVLAEIGAFFLAARLSKDDKGVGCVTWVALSAAIPILAVYLFG